MIPLLKPRIPETAAARVAEVLASGYINHGDVVKEFERALARRLDAQDVVAVNSCTSALVIALKLAKAQRVVTTPMTFVATTTAIYQAGAVPIWADVESPYSCQMSPDEVRQAIREHQADAIMAVAWSGWSPQLDTLRDIADEYRVPLILDAAQALGAEYGGKPIHAWADYTCYSFSPTKHLTTVDGGAIICRDPEQTAWARRLSWFGLRRNLKPGERMASDQDIPRWGLKANATNVMAAFGLAGLEGLDEALTRCRANAERYRAELHTRRDDWAEDEVPSPWLYTVFVDDPARFIAHMHAAGIQVAQPHRRNDEYAFACAARRPLKRTSLVQTHYVSIPVGWFLSDDDVSQVIEAVRAYPAVYRDRS